MYVSDLRKAKRDLGWEPRIGIDQGLDDLSRWVDANRGLFEGGVNAQIDTQPSRAHRGRLKWIETPGEAPMQPELADRPVLLPRLSEAERTARMKAVHPPVKERAR